jgi:hypothetical protein
MGHTGLVSFTYAQEYIDSVRLSQVITLGVEWKPAPKIIIPVAWSGGQDWLRNLRDSWHLPSFGESPRSASFYSLLGFSSFISSFLCFSSSSLAFTTLSFPAQSSSPKQEKVSFPGQQLWGNRPLKLTWVTG